jgi:hypothetical protein
VIAGVLGVPVTLAVFPAIAIGSWRGARITRAAGLRPRARVVAGLAGGAAPR